MRIIFMGTPEFAVPSLRILVENGYEVVGVVTATDKWGGRGNKQLIESDVKKYAVEAGLNVLQPEKLRHPEFLEQLRALKADLQIVVAFRMLPEVVWNMPPLGTFNLHGSLLPKYRGAAPLNWAIINGEKETGLTTFFLKHEIDTGDLLFQYKTPIGEDETVGELHDRLKLAGAELTLKTVRAIEAGDYAPFPQDAAQACHAPKIFKETCQINWNQTTQQVHDFIRGLSPYPTAWTTLPDGHEIKVYRAQMQLESHSLPAGTFQANEARTEFRVSTTDGFMQLLDVQVATKKRMAIRDFLLGYK